MDVGGVVVGRVTWHQNRLFVFKVIVGNNFWDGGVIAASGDAG